MSLYYLFLIYFMFNFNNDIFVQSFESKFVVLLLNLEEFHKCLFKLKTNRRTKS